ncbi:hypothetical protein [Photobacterium leiognathi]|uniref:hypothetical protein n=1 Tax=Photobacterium leiognathi TaxID=553611 RepID=UPI002733F5FC|nr:hypothetical protein [Photobacterium leiognathi]
MQIFYYITALYLIRKLNLTKESVINYFLIAVFLDFLFCLIFKMSPTLKEFFEIPFYNSELNQEIYDSNFNIKFMGLGGKLFLGGVVAGVGVILSTYMILLKGYLRYYFSFVICLIYGILLSRSVIIAVVISSFFLFIYIIVDIFKGRLKKRSFYFSVILITIIGLLLFILYIFRDSNDFFRWAYEIIGTVLISKDTVDSNSLNGLSNYYKNFIFDTKMILVGNGIWSFNETDLGKPYVVDAGFLRVLYSFGVINLFIYIIYNIFIIMPLYIYSRTTLDKILALILFIFFITYSFKGFINVSIIFAFISAAVISDRNVSNDKA